MTPPADKGKEAKTDADGGENEQIDGALVFSIEKLQEIQDELEKVNEEASDKVLEVEQKYSEIRRPVYLRRSDIIKTIPGFWLTAFLSHPLLNELLIEEDQKIFKYLESVDVDDSKDVKSGYSITFNFSENPYFEDRKLMKTYAFADDGTTTINATSIKWKEGMGIANGNAIKKKGNKRPLVEERGGTTPVTLSDRPAVFTSSDEWSEGWGTARVRAVLSLADFDDPSPKDGGWTVCVRLAADFVDEGSEGWGKARVRVSFVSPLTSLTSGRRVGDDIVAVDTSFDRLVVVTPSAAFVNTESEGWGTCCTRRSFVSVLPPSTLSSKGGGQAACVKASSRRRLR